jgi:hypothetical protein
MAKDDADERNKVVIRGYHPEMELIYDSGFNNADTYLEPHPRAHNLKPNAESRVSSVGEDKRPK